MTKLCPRGKAAAKRKFKVYPSAYANAYASKICAGKIKDPSGVKRKDFRGPKPAAKGRMIKASTGAALDSKAKTFKPIPNPTKGTVSISQMQERSGREKAKKIKRKLRNIGNQIKGFGKEIIGKKVGGMTAGSRSALGRIQKANMIEAKRGKFSDQGKSFIKRRMALAGSLPPMGKGPRGMGKIDDANTFIKRRMLLAGPKSILPSQSDVASKAKKIGKKLLPKRIKAIISLVGAAAAGAAGQKALDKRRKKKELKGDVKGSIAPYKVDKKKMGGLKAELNNPAKGYMTGGMAEYYKDLM